MILMAAVQSSSFAWPRGNCGQCLRPDLVPNLSGFADSTGHSRACTWWRNPDWAGGCRARSKQSQRLSMFMLGWEVRNSRFVPLSNLLGYLCAPYSLNWIFPCMFRVTLNDSAYNKPGIDSCNADVLGLVCGEYLKVNSTAELWGHV